MAKVTIKELLTELEALKKNYDVSRVQLSEAKTASTVSKTEAQETREQFADLKKRLHASEMEVARLNGYLARVREDDVVREELIPTGDPEGGQRLVPKRKPEYLGNREPDCTDFFKSEGRPYYERDRPKPKHWIEY